VLGVVAAASVGVAACGGSDSTDSGAGAKENASATTKPTELRWSLAPGVIAADLSVYVADTYGLFAKQNLKPTYVGAQSAMSQMQLVGTNQADFTLADVTSVALARQSGQANTSFVAAMWDRVMARLVCRKGIVPAGKQFPDVMKDLAGKTFAATGPATMTENYPKYAFIAAGMKPSSAKIVIAGSTAGQLQALQAERVDCALLTSPAPQQAGESMDAVFSPDLKDEGPPEYYSSYMHVGLVVGDDYAAKNPEVVKKTSAALMEASKIIHDPANSTEISERVKRFFPDLPDATLLQAIKDASGASNAYLTTAQVATAVKIFNALNPSKKLSSDQATLESFVSAPVRDLIANPPAK
jgi:ABC-type nitrate/sulfonate/bicarbonate transport system substrate-binding protein